MKRRAVVMLWIAAAVAASRGVSAQAPVEGDARLTPTALATVTVGIEGRVVHRWTGPALRAQAVDDEAPIALRIATSGVDADGSTLYDVRFIATEAGNFDLAQFLERVDGRALDGAGAIPVRVGALLPEGHTGDLFDVRTVGLPRMGGQRAALMALGALWLAPVVWVGVRRLRRRPARVEMALQEGPTLADELRPLVERAIAGEISVEDRARLERLMVAHWRERLGIEDVDHAGAMARLREAPEAGALLLGIEEWLHRPAEGRAAVDIGAALAPYRAALGAGRGAR